MWRNMGLGEAVAIADNGECEPLRVRERQALEVGADSASTWMLVTAAAIPCHLLEEGHKGRRSLECDCMLAQATEARWREDPLCRGGHVCIQLGMRAPHSGPCLASDRPLLAASIRWSPEIELIEFSSARCEHTSAIS
jgi:hypothetical protein